MIKILFSPAEGKNNGGNEIARELLGSNNARKNIFDEYNNIIDSKNEPIRLP